MAVSLDQIIEWRRQGLALRQIAARAGVSRQRIDKRIKKSGVRLCGRCRVPSDEEFCATCERFFEDCANDDLPACIVAAKHHTTPKTVLETRRAAGILIERGKWARKLPRPIPAKVYDLAIPAKELAVEYGVTPATISRLRITNGFRQRAVRRKWTTEEDAKLLGWLREGVTQHEIARRLGLPQHGKFDNSGVQARMAVLRRRGEVSF